MGLLGNRTNF